LGQREERGGKKKVVLKRPDLRVICREKEVPEAGGGRKELSGKIGLGGLNSSGSLEKEGEGVSN